MPRSAAHKRACTRSVLCVLPCCRGRPRRESVLCDLRMRRQNKISSQEDILQVSCRRMPGVHQRVSRSLLITAESRDILLGILLPFLCGLATFWGILVCYHFFSCHLFDGMCDNCTPTLVILVTWLRSRLYCWFSGFRRSNREILLTLLAVINIR